MLFIFTCFKSTISTLFINASPQRFIVLFAPPKNNKDHKSEQQPYCPPTLVVLLIRTHNYAVMPPLIYYKFLLLGGKVLFLFRFRDSPLIRAELVVYPRLHGQKS